MNFAPFAVATTNIFPCANSTAGAQLLSEFNLRARESVATPEQVKYMIGPSYVHSQDDFSVSLLKDDAGNTLGSNTVFVINEGKAVINGHFVQSLVPIQIDLAVANQYLLEKGKPELKGKLKVGLRVMYSTEATMAGAMLKENEKYYEGVHVVVLPPDQFHLPTDPGYGGIDKQSYVTAHLWLADISFVNGRLSEVIKQNEHKIEMMPASRISDIEGVLSGQFLKSPNVNAGKLYVYSGKVTESTAEGDVSKSGWCEAQQSLMVWDEDPARLSKAEYRAFLDSTRIDGDKVEARFATNADDEVVFVVPHKQVDGSEKLLGITDTAGNEWFYAPKTYKLPVADYEMGTPGTVDKAFIKNIKNIDKKFEEFKIQSLGQQKAYVPELNNINELPPVNQEWSIGDYVLVGRDYTVLVDGDTSTPPSTMYFVTPGYVTSISEATNVLPDNPGIQLDVINIDRTTEELPVFELGNAADGYKYRGIANSDYLVRNVSADVPEIEYNLEEAVTGRWYTSRNSSNGNYVVISKVGCLDSSGLEDEGSLHLSQSSLEHLSEEVSAKLNVADAINLSEATISFKYKTVHSSGSSVTVQFNCGSVTVEKELAYANDWVECTFTVDAHDTPVGGKLLSITLTADQMASIYIDQLSIKSKSKKAGQPGAELLPDLVRNFYNFRKTTEYFYVTETGNKLYSDVVMLTGNIKVATEHTIGGFYNVPSTYTDAGYVRLNENGHLVLNDYALLRTGVLAYQLGEDFNTSPGISSANIQEQLNEYVNQRVAFPNEKHIQEAENPNVIHVTLNLSEEDTANTINIYDIDSRFNTCVYVHIRGTANDTLKVNISDIAKLRLEIADECNCIVNIARCNLYYDAHILDRLSYIADMDLWYERFTDSDEWLQVTGRTITQISGPVGWVSEDHYNGEDTSLEDIHYAYALRSLTFSSSGNIIGVDMAIKNELSHIGEDNNEYIHVSNFRIPQASGFTYPESRLQNKIKLSGRFVSVPATNAVASGVSIVETDFVAVTNKYSDTVLNNGITGTITFLTKVHTIENVAGLGTAQELTGWASGDYHVFHGEVAYESNT